MTVYVVQQHRRFDSLTREWREVHDLTPARAHGELAVLLSPTAVPYGDPAPMIRELHEKLDGYDPERDYLLPMGNPALIGWATAVAAEYGGGRVRMLVWSARDRSYIPTDAKLFPDCE